MKQFEKHNVGRETRQEGVERKKNVEFVNSSSRCAARFYAQ